MNSKIMCRVLDEAKYMIKTNKTVREISRIFNVSKSTVHKDLHERLPSLDRSLYHSIDEIMKYHIDVRHIRGGEATRKKYEKLDTN